MEIMQEILPTKQQNQFAIIIIIMIQFS